MMSLGANHGFSTTDLKVNGKSKHDTSSWPMFAHDGFEILKCDRNGLQDISESALPMHYKNELTAAAGIVLLRVVVAKQCVYVGGMEDDHHNWLS